MITVNQIWLILCVWWNSFLYILTDIHVNDTDPDFGITRYLSQQNIKYTVTSATEFNVQYNMDVKGYTKLNNNAKMWQLFWKVSSSKITLGIPTVC